LLLAQEPDGVTALHVACSNGDVEIVQMLLDGKAQVDLADKSHLTPLFLRNNSRRFLSNPNRGGVTGRAGVIAHLGQAKANLDAQDELGRKAIHHQALGGDWPATRALLRAKANAEAVDHEGRTALHLASLYGNVEVVEGLLRGMWDHAGKDVGLNAEPNPRDNFEATPLFYALQEGKPPGGGGQYAETIRLLRDAEGIVEGPPASACTLM